MGEGKEAGAQEASRQVHLESDLPCATGPALWSLKGPAADVAVQLINCSRLRVNG